jgi:hypothetical protein
MFKLSAWEDQEWATAMSRLILKMSMSVDGFVGGPNGEIDWIFRSLDTGATT